MPAFELFCALILALGFAVFVAFAGYRFFLVLLPIWGFFFGFTLGAQTIQALVSGSGFLADATAFVVALIMGVLFAALSYLFYLVAVALFSASIGYGIGIAIMGAILPSFGFINWLVAIILAVAMAFVVLRFNVQKYVIIIGTALLGGGLATATLMGGFYGVNILQLFENPLQVLLGAAGFWGWLVFLVVAVGGLIVQLRSTATYTVEAYENRM